MTRLQKLHEAIAIAKGANSQLMIGFMRLGLDDDTRISLGPHVVAISNELESFVASVNELIVIEKAKTK